MGKIEELKVVRLKAAIKGAEVNAEALKGDEAFSEYGKLIELVKERCVAALIEKYFVDE